MTWATNAMQCNGENAMVRSQKPEGGKTWGKKEKKEKEKQWVFFFYLRSKNPSLSLTMDHAWLSANSLKERNDAPSAFDFTVNSTARSKDAHCEMQGSCTDSFAFFFIWFLNLVFPSVKWNRNEFNQQCMFRSNFWWVIFKERRCL